MNYSLSRFFVFANTSKAFEKVLTDLLPLYYYNLLVPFNMVSKPPA